MVPVDPGKKQEKSWSWAGWNSHRKHSSLENSWGDL